MIISNQITLQIVGYVLTLKITDWIQLIISLNHLIITQVVIIHANGWKQLIKKYSYELNGPKIVRTFKINQENLKEYKYNNLSIALAFF